MSFLCNCSSFSLLQIERDTFGMLQCHPYPNEYVDTSKQCSHCAFFMGLQRKQGVRIQEGQQFDIRGTVDEFRHSVNMYMFWKPGMEIFVSHVRRKQIPSYVFPEGYKRPRPSRHTSQHPAKASGDDGGVDDCGSGSPNKQLKRKNDAEYHESSPDKPAKRASLSPNKGSSPSDEVSSGSGGALQVGSYETRGEHVAAGKVGSADAVLVEKHLRKEKGCEDDDASRYETTKQNPFGPNVQMFLSPSKVSSSRFDKVCRASLDKEVKVEYFAAGIMAGADGSVEQQISRRADGEQLKPAKQAYKTENTDFRLEVCSNTSDAASLVSSCEGVGLESSVAGSREELAEVIERSDNHDLLQADVLEADSEALSENECIKGNGEVQNGLAEELEVDLFVFMRIVMFICVNMIVNLRYPSAAALNMKILWPKSQAGSLMR